MCDILQHQKSPMWIPFIVFKSVTLNTRLESETGSLFNPNLLVFLVLSHAVSVATGDIG